MYPEFFVPAAEKEKQVFTKGESAEYAVLKRKNKISVSTSRILVQNHGLVPNHSPDGYCHRYILAVL